MWERSRRKGVDDDDEKYCTVEEKGANDEHVRNCRGKRSQ
jgi:hypothetical protein